MLSIIASLPCPAAIPEHTDYWAIIVIAIQILSFRGSVLPIISRPAINWKNGSGTPI
jgi:hypothetical protein